MVIGDFFREFFYNSNFMWIYFYALGYIRDMALWSVVLTKFKISRNVASVEL